MPTNDTVGKYWKVKDDGALWKCDECKERYSHTKVVIILTPNGNKGMYCLDCIDSHWLENAEFQGYK